MRKIQKMMIIFGQGLVYWTGMITGIFFVLSLAGCACVYGKRWRDKGLLNSIGKYHKYFIFLAFAFFLTHFILAALSRNLNIWI